MKLFQAMRIARRRRLLFTAGRRLIDVIVAATVLVVGLPLWLITVLGIMISDPGPVLFRQVRIGRHGVPFTMFKFRSMYVDAERRRQDMAANNQHGTDAITFKDRHDPRIFWWGRLLRRLSIDEFPQLWNVLRGDMSLVGPRPALPKEVARYSQHDRLRLAVRPGITCYWQVQGRADIPFEQQVELDIDYVLTDSLVTRCRILWATIPAVVSGRGAY